MDWHPRTSVCWATATREWARDRLQEKHANDEPLPGELHYLAGRWAWVSQHPPEQPEDEFNF